MSDNKFYWLKVKKDFFKRHDIRILESLENGKEISYFYFKLMLESVDHDGELRFSQKVPYSPEMLSTITNTDLDIVKAAIQTLSDFGMIEISPDGTIVIEKVKSMIGSASDTDGARRVRRFREKQKLQNVTDTLQSVTGCVTKDNESKSKSKSKSKSYIERNSKERKFTPPTLQEVQSYCQERNNNVDPKTFFDYYSSNEWKDSKGNQVKNWKQKLITWENHDNKQASLPCTPIKPKYGVDWGEFERLKKEEMQKRGEA